MPLNRETSEMLTFTEEAITFRGSVGNLFLKASATMPAEPLCATALPAKAWLQITVWLSLNPRDNGEEEGAPFPFQPSSGLLMVCAAAYLQAG